MSTLVLELRQGDVMIVNGAPIRFRTKARVELAAKARFLFGKQIMAPDQVFTPARRIYFALQAAYVGSDEERAQGLATARELVADFGQVAASPLAFAIVERALAAAEQDDCYKALMLLRRVTRHEDTLTAEPEEARVPDPGVHLLAIEALSRPPPTEARP